jgi:AraC family transcriptional regulator of adaptative response/methylated-DNA-[protein]-cysteine methyltransferase
MKHCSEETMWRAVAASDPSYDGRFCYGVKTTGVFCRPSCKSRPPRRENILFFPGAAAALAQGYRPCKRCRPDAPLTPGQDTVEAACRLLDERYADPAILAALPGRIGLSRSHLARLFKHHTGRSPQEHLQAIRINKARGLLAAGALTATAVAYEVGFNTPARFYAAFRAATGCSPRAWQRDNAVATAYLETPIGPLAVSATAAGVVAVRYVAEPGRPSPDRPACLSQALAELAAYFAGRLTTFTVPLMPEGTAFQRKVWAALAAVPFGRTISYRDLAATLGSPRAARAVGAANGRNPVNIIIPCHRVVGADGSLTGYSGGLDKKHWLLNFERTVLGGRG